MNLKDALNKLNKAKTLLKEAECPICNGSGKYSDYYGNEQRCRWCYEVKRLMDNEDI